MRKPKLKASRFVERGRLVYNMQTPDVGFWEQHWHNHFSTHIYRKAEKGILADWLEKPFNAWLPRQGPIIEAGCGLGQLVLALRARGYEVEGIEMANATVEMVKENRPDLPIRLGDVCCFDVPDGYYEAYISMGVVEHRREGPGRFLKEAWRVLKDGGIALVSVPYFNALRRFKARLGFYRYVDEGLPFYQYAFTDIEFPAMMEQYDFEVVDTMSYDPFKGLRDEIPGLRRTLELLYVGPCLKRLIKNLVRHFPGVADRVGHMQLVVGRKQGK